MGEKFAANPVTGTGAMTVPISVSPGRAGFGPQLAISYNSGSGNGPFGFGWQLSLPSITRKTDKGLPQYHDVIDSDVFILSDAEDLVPVFRQDHDGSWVAAHAGYQRDDVGHWVRDAAGRLVIHEDKHDDYLIRYYRPRLEGLFARIERWTHTTLPDEVHWRSLTKDNILTVYGRTAEARIVDPLDGTRIFSWLICESRDDKGNAVLYRYKAEDGVGVELKRAHERQRGLLDAVERTANRYLKRIHYGNPTPLLDGGGRRPTFLDHDAIKAQLDHADWLFEVVFDYGEHPGPTPTPVEAQPWSTHVDPFSTYRSGFEVRTGRTCQRVLMFHHVKDVAEVGRDCLVRSTDFTYSATVDPNTVEQPVYTFLNAVTQTGYRQRGGGYEQNQMPRVEFEYTQPTIQETVEELDAASLEQLPIGIDGSVYRWLDLHGEGVPGLLTELPGAWYYRRNLSPVPVPQPDGTERVVARFAPLETVRLKPNVSLSDGAEFLDLAGDGQPDVVVMNGPVTGFYKHAADDDWELFRPFGSGLNRCAEANAKYVDLNGDGHADLLITENDAFVWHPSLAEAGFGPAQRVAYAFDEEEGPRVVFADSNEAIMLADMSGDGLSDLVRVRNGDVCYWPNLGYGRFGAKVTMDHAPWFDEPDQFEQKRLRLADIDGSGTTDLIYAHRDGVRLYFNQAGNSWSRAKKLAVFPRVDEVVSLMPLDLLGNGTLCLVWSSPLPGDARCPVKYVNLMGEHKPHLLHSTRNNLGAETTVTYAPSTKFYLHDRAAGKPWVTRLAFPVHVVERVETIDHISQNRFVTEYAYHHGYFDGDEREFRGFGMVEQWDTERFAAIGGATNQAVETHVPPVHTKTWFHTGAYLKREEVTRYYENEYFREPGLTSTAARELLLDDTILPTTWTLEEERESCRALKGSVLRREVYALDGKDVSEDYPSGWPYSVAEHSYSVERLQERGDNRHACFFTHAREAINFHYERRPHNPRVQHSFTLAVDAFGNVVQQATLAYGRRQADLSLPLADRVKQQQSYLTYTQNRFTNALSEVAGAYRTPLFAESRTYEVRRPQPELSNAATPLLRFEQLEAFIGEATTRDVPYDDDTFLSTLPAVAADATELQRHYRRLLEHVRSYYRADTLADLLPLGELQARAVPGESYRLAFTATLLEKLYQRPRVGQPDEALIADAATLLGIRGGYVDLDGDGAWWTPSGRMFFSPEPSDTPADELTHALAHFFLPKRYRDPFQQNTIVTYDSYDLLMRETRDALNNRVTVDVNDYRVLQPRLLSDANRNQTEAAFDALGMVIGLAVMGKPGDDDGDRLDDEFPREVSATQLDTLLLQPRVATTATTSVAAPLVHELLGNATIRFVYDLTRYQRLGEPPLVVTIARETHVSDLDDEPSKLQVSVSYSDGFSREIQKKVSAEPGPVAGVDANPRWVGSGWTIYNNKGNSVRRYEPFFSTTHRFEFGREVGVSSILFYDPVERVIATLHPNHTYEKALFDAWNQTTYDVNDTCAPRLTETGDPRTDPDIRGYVAAYFATQPAWETWYAARQALPTTDPEHVAADKAAAHAATPTTQYFDALGRPFLSVVENRVVCTGHDLDGTTEPIRLRSELDIEGNLREVRDERRLPVAHLPTGATEQRLVMRYAYDMLSTRVVQQSMEAGTRWLLNDVSGKPITAWDSRGHQFTTEYDVLRRPVKQFVRGTTADSDPRTLNRTVLIDLLVYGEPPLNATPAEEAEAQRLNLRTRSVQHFDSAGVTTNARLDENGVKLEAYDFKGNVRCSTRQLLSDYQAVADWQANPTLDDERFVTRTRYDAINRPVQTVAPFSSNTTLNVTQPVFNEANLLERVDVWLERAIESDELLDAAVEAPSPVGVANVDYNAKGQRTRIRYKNEVETRYDYDPLTFRLRQLHSTRPARFVNDCPQPPLADWPGCGVQALHYTYDPVGNITHLRDDAQQTIYFNNQRVEPRNAYTYDAVYRLIHATGREHLGQGGPAAHTYNDAGRTRLPHSGEGTALGRYVERFVYDAVGNVLQMQHRGTDPLHSGWTRTYDYDEASQLDATQFSNRLTSTRVGTGPVEPCATTAHPYDAHGNMPCLPHLFEMQWDYKDRLLSTRRQAINTEDEEGRTHDGERTYYVYDATGQRVRKVTERNGTKQRERLYLGSLELYREATGPNAGLQRETLHVMDDQQRIALVETRNAIDDGTLRQLIRYQFSNHLSSATLELDHTAAIISYEEYSPYGSTTYQAVRDQTETPKRYRYTGKERDEETGFTYHVARYCAPWLARWVSCDPMGLVDGPNLYRYARNTPLVASDPQGTDPNTNSGDRNDARNYVSFDSFRAGVEGPWTDEGLQATWDEAHPSPAAQPGVTHLQPAASTTSAGVGATSVGLRAAFTPLGPSGELLQGPFIVWSGESVNAARAMEAAGEGYTIFSTQAGVQMEQELAALRQVPGFPGAIRTELPREEAGAIMEWFSRSAARDAGISGVGVTTANPAGTIPPGSFQAMEIRTARFYGTGMGLLNMGGGALMFASIDTKRDPALVTAGRITSGTASVVGGGMEIGGAWLLRAGLVRGGAALSGVGTLVAVPLMAYDIGRPRGIIATDPALRDRAVQEGRNAFCAQCHGPGGALDPNNDWNAGGERRAAFVRRLEWHDLGE